MRTRAELSVRFALVGWLAGVLMAASAEEAASQTNIQRNGPLRNFSGIEEVVFECTTEESFVDMPPMTRNFTLGGSANEEVVVMFHASAAFTLVSGQTTDSGYVRLEIDNVVQSPGDQVPFISAETEDPQTTGAYSFTWQSAPLTPGNHTANILWRTDLGSEFCVDARTMIILHR